jgi:hypothetical protein
MFFFCDDIYYLSNIEMFRKISDALAVVNDSTFIMAEDVSTSGQKVFRVGNIVNLSRQYNGITDPHWYECLLENRPTRIFLDVESYDSVDIHTIIETLSQAILHKFKVVAQVEVLDSCDSSKYSWHIVCTNLYLKNVYHVGAFVRRLVLATQEPAIDTAVYTKNRMFRVCGSSKFGSTRVLKGNRPWEELLVQFGPPAPCLVCLEIDESEPVSCSSPPSQIFYFSGGQWHNNQGSNGSNGCNGTTRTYCPMLEPVLNYIDKEYNANLSRHTTSMTSQGRLMVSAKSKQCAIAKRTHKGNNIWFSIDCVHCRVFQRCYDEECKGQKHEVQVPPLEWSLWSEKWSAVLSTPKNKNTLYNMID